MQVKTANNLRKRAERLLKQYQTSTPICKQTIFQLIEELSLYQIELEVQNEDLIKTKTELLESNSKYTELYELAPIGYFAINEDGLIKEVNQAGCDLLGLKKTALINRCFSRYIVSEYQGLFSQYRKRAFRELMVFSFELKLIKWTQPACYALLECKAIKDEMTGSKQLLMFASDITARKQAEAALHHQRTKIAAIDRLRSLNEFIYDMANDQNRALTMINNYLHGCIKRLENGNCRAQDLLPILKKTVEQNHLLIEMVLRRRNLAKCTLHFEYTMINQLLCETILLIKYENTQFPLLIQYEANDSLPTIKLDKYHIQQVILNLARNSIEAMRDSKIREPKLLIEVLIESPGMLQVMIYDNGPGISQDVIPMIFEPHFSTKPYCIGLGLTVSRAIIEKHGGELKVSENPSGGSCFSFNLPYATSLNH